MLQIADDAVEHVLAAHEREGFRFRRVERDPDLVEARSDQRSSLGFRQQGTIGVEEDVDASILEVADHPGQVLDEHGLADAVKDDPCDLGERVDDPGKQFPAHIRGRLKLLEGSRAGLAQKIAPIRDLDIEADRVRHPVD